MRRSKLEVGSLNSRKLGLLVSAICVTPLFLQGLQLIARPMGEQAKSSEQQTSSAEKRRTAGLLFRQADDYYRDADSPEKSKR
jgi:hypothetical protein